jgi:predicted ribosome quality control (RQC) complex YloA/Tae2 family protein
MPDRPERAPAAPRRPLPAMDHTSLRAVLAELRPELVPSRFEKAQQADAQGIQLALRHLEGVQWLEVSWLAEAPRLLAIPPPPRRGEGSTLAQQLQHGLRGLALVSLSSPGWERVVEMGFARRPGEDPRRWLVAELMGRHSNLFLLDEERRVIALARQVRADQSRLRPIATGDTYTPPPPPAGEPPRRSETEASWRRRLSLLPLPLGDALRRSYQGIGPALARQLVEGPGTGKAGADSTAVELLQRPVTGLEEAHWQQLWRHWQAWLAALEEERFTLRWQGPDRWCCWAADPPPAWGALMINRGLAAYYAGRLGQRRLEQRRRTLAQRLAAALAREERDAALQQERLVAAAGSEELQRQADALLARITPTREAISEAQKLYQRARKLRRSVAAITPLLEGHRQRQAWLEASLGYLEDAGSEEQLQELEQELEEWSGRRSRSRSAAREGRRGGRATPREPVAGTRPLELRSPAGLLLQVGRNHRQNEWISLRQARRGDLWFHAQEIPGSHVVLKASEGMAGEADLAAAADLAAHFSRGRGSGRVPVVMVPTETLQRIPGAGAGTVRHRGGEILWGEPARALALLETPNVGQDRRP